MGEKMCWFKKSGEEGFATSSYQTGNHNKPSEGPKNLGLIKCDLCDGPRTKLSLPNQWFPNWPHWRFHCTVLFLGALCGWSVQGHSVLICWEPLRALKGFENGHSYTSGSLAWISHILSCSDLTDWRSGSLARLTDLLTFGCFNYATVTQWHQLM